MAKTSIGDLGSLLQEVFKEQDGMRHLLTALVELGMEEEVARHVGAQRHERRADRTGRRNGYKPRRLRTRGGELELAVPQVRGCDPYHPSMFGKWQRSERALMTACAEMYFQGVSTRQVRKVLEVMCAGEISSATVSRVSQELDEKLSLFRHRRLDGISWPYLQIDARYEKVRVAGRVVSQAVLVVVGFNALGRREVLDYRVGDSESQETWGEVFQGLKDRGMRGVELVVSDAHTGIRAAMSRHLQGTSWQRCRVHYKRELMRKVSYKVVKELMSDVSSVFAGEDEGECLRRGEEMATRWQGRYPAVASMLREGLGDCLTVLAFPEHHRRRLTSTNLLENIMRRLKKRTAVVGVFPSRSSCDRLVGSQLLELHESWLAKDQTWFNMEQAPAA